MTGSQLSVRAQIRAAESERRRGEMERLQHLSAALLATDTVSEAADRAIREIVSLFGGGAVLRVEGARVPFKRASPVPRPVNPSWFRPSTETALLSCTACRHPSVRSALVNLIGLVLGWSRRGRRTGSHRSGAARRRVEKTLSSMLWRTCIPYTPDLHQSRCIRNARFRRFARCIQPGTG